MKFPGVKAFQLVCKNSPGLIIFFVLITLTTLMVSSCKKEEDQKIEGPSGTGILEYKGIQYDITMAYYELYGQFDGIYNYELYLFSDGVDIDNETGFGNVAAIYFSTYSPPLPEGTTPYYDESSNPYPNFEAEVVLDFDLDADTGIRMNYFDEGGFILNKSSDGKTYTIQLSCILAGKDTLSGHYSGSIIEY